MTVNGSQNRRYQESLHNWYYIQIQKCIGGGLEGLTTQFQTAYHVMIIIYLTQHMKKIKLTASTQVPENF